MLSADPLLFPSSYKTRPRSLYPYTLTPIHYPPLFKERQIFGFTIPTLAMRKQQNVGVPHTLFVLRNIVCTTPHLLPFLKALAHGMASVGIGVITVHQKVLVVVIVFLQVGFKGRRIGKLVEIFFVGRERLRFAIAACRRSSTISV